jgi:hypothetical protein
MNPPHIAFILVGDWWCAVTGLGSSSLCTFPSGYPYTCPQYSSCKAEGLDFESTENRLVGTDYAAASPYWQQLQLYYCYPALDCAGQSLLRRRYNGQAFYGPITTQQATSPGPTLNSLASGFGIHSQTAASDTVFVFLYGPSLACGQYATTNWGVPGQNGQYGFVYANVVLEDYAKNCVGPIQNGPGNDLNLQSPDPLTPLQFATYATSHEVDEAITSPSDGTNPRGWVVPSESGQLADPCADRTQSGNSLGYDSTANGNNWPYYNFTRDLYGTVVAAFVLFNVNSTPNSCYPDVSTSVPSG